VRRLRDEEVLLKQLLAGPFTKQQLKNKLNFYKFSGTVTVLTTDDSGLFIYCLFDDCKWLYTYSKVLLKISPHVYTDQSTGS
jgi:hypothetical protein